MNTVVESTEKSLALSTQEQEALNGVEWKIEESVGARAIVPFDLVKDAFKFNEFGKQALVQVEKAVLDTPDKFGLGGDLMRAITQNLRACEEARKSRTDKVNSLVDYITSLFKPGKTKLESAKAGLQKKLNEYERKEREKREAEAAEKKKVAEEAALALASTQQAMGDTDGAHQVLDQATKTIDKIDQGTKVVGHGAYGSTSSVRGRWVGSVKDPAAFVIELAKVAPDKILDYLEFKQSALNKLAKKQGEDKDAKPIAGFEYSRDENVGVR
jgi:hypothetical protein